MSEKIIKQNEMFDIIENVCKPNSHVNKRTSQMEKRKQKIHIKYQYTYLSGRKLKMEQGTGIHK